MDEFGGLRYEGIGIGNTIRRKRTQTSRRPKPEVHALSLSSTPPSDDAGKISSDENAVNANPKRKVFNVNQCASVATRPEGEYLHKRVQTDGIIRNNASRSNGDANEEAQTGINHKQRRVPVDGGRNENKLRKVKLKVGGVSRTIPPKSKFATVGSPKNTDGTRSRPKLILQDNSGEKDSPLGKTIGLQGVPWKDFSRGGFNFGRENSSIGKIMEINSAVRQGEKPGHVRKSKRVPKKRVLDGDFDEEEDDEIRYLEKLKTVKVAAACRDFDDESSKKDRSLRVSDGRKYEISEDLSSCKKSKSDSISVNADFEDEDLVPDDETEGYKGKKPRKDSPDSPTENKRETSLTSRQRALLSGRDSSSAATQIEFPNGLPPAPPRKQKEKLSEVEQQLKKAEATERRRIQNEKAARESEAEAIRKILGQDSSRKKREDKLKKRQEELAQEKAANSKMLPPKTIRTVIGPTGTVVAFSEDMGLPSVFDPKPKPSCYPPPREKCAGPSCTNAYKYRDSKSNLPLCSLQCYKSVNARTDGQ